MPAKPATAALPVNPVFGGYENVPSLGPAVRSLLLFALLGLACAAPAASTNEVLGVWRYGTTDRFYEFLPGGVLKDYFNAPDFPPPLPAPAYHRWTLLPSGEIGIVYKDSPTPVRGTIQGQRLTLPSVNGQTRVYYREGTKPVPVASPAAAPAPTVQSPTATTPALTQTPPTLPPLPKPPPGSPLVGVWMKDVGSGAAREIFSLRLSGDGTYEEFRDRGQPDPERLNSGSVTGGTWSVSGNEVTFQYHYAQRPERKKVHFDFYGQTLVITHQPGGERETLQRTTERPAATVRTTGTAKEAAQQKAAYDKVMKDAQEAIKGLDELVRKARTNPPVQPK